MGRFLQNNVPTKDKTDSVLNNVTLWRVRVTILSVETQ